MAETAPQLATTTDEPPPLAFADLDGAKHWAKTLPQLPLGPAYEALIGQLRAMAAAELPARERATLVEVMREPSLRDATRASRSRRATASSKPPSRRSRCGTPCGSNTRCA
jgi:hypothetical protein